MYVHVCYKVSVLLLTTSKLTCSLSTVCATDFPSAPNLTAAAAAQSLDWAPVSVQSLSVIYHTLTQNSSSGTALLSLTLSAELGVSGSITDVVTAISSSRRRKLLASSTSEYPNALQQQLLLSGSAQCCPCV